MHVLTRLPVQHTAVSLRFYSLPFFIGCAATTYIASPILTLSLSLTFAFFLPHCAVSCMDMSTTNFMHNYVRVSCERIGEGGHCNHPEFAAKINEECPMTCGRCRTDTCSFSRDGVCDEPYLCAQGTDCTDCGNCEERLTDENLIPKQGEAVRISMATKARY